MGELQLKHQNPHNQRALEGHDLEWYWGSGYSSQHQSRVQDYNGFNDYTPCTADPIYETGMPLTFQMDSTPGTAYSRLQSWMMPQVPRWPSTLTSQSTCQASLFSSAGPPITLTSATSLSAISTHSADVRATLTNSDRKRMCKYCEENPTVSKLKIAEMFGVHRSTVSKILSQKEKYINLDGDSLSSIKKPKSKLSELEHTLSNWAKKRQKQGLALSDAIIQEQARFFAQAVGTPKGLLSINSTSWLERFKKENHLVGAGAEQSEGTSFPPSNVHPHKAISSASPSRSSPASTTEIASALPTIGESMLPSSTQVPNSMQPPALPSISDTGGREPFADSLVTTPSQEEAACALEFVMSFFQSHKANFFVESQEYVAIRKLIEKLRIKPSSQPHASDTRYVTEPDVVKTTLEAFDVHY